METKTENEIKKNFQDLFIEAEKIEKDLEKRKLFGILKQFQEAMQDVRGCDKWVNNYL